jgi:CRISPR/Cas system CMR-associated protein Cmr5 small subunit
MAVYVINEQSSKEEIEEFYSLYVESFPKLLIYLNI